MAHIPPKWVYINIVDECFLSISKVNEIRAKVHGQKNDSRRSCINLDGPEKIYERNPKVSYIGLKDMSHWPERPSTIVLDRSL